TNTLGAPATFLAPTSGTGIEIKGGSFAATDSVSISNIAFQGNGTLTTGTDYGIWVDDTAVFDSLSVTNSTFSGWRNVAFYMEGNSATGQGVGHTYLTDLRFEDNGKANNGGTGDISFFEWNESATLKNLVLIGSRDGVTSFERS